MIHFQEIDGRKIACWVNNGSFLPDRKTLVFIHGAGLDHTSWIQQYTPLKNAFNIAAIDLPGHGRSEGPGEQEVPAYVGGFYWPPYDEAADQREVEKYYVRYAVKELRGAIAFIEKHTQRKMDWAKLEELVDLVDRTWNIFIEAYELRKAIPTPMDTGDAMNTMVPLAFMLGTQEAYDFYKELYNELKQKNEKKEGVVTDEK